MNNPLYIHHVRLVRPGESIAAGSALIRRGRIEELDGPAPADAILLDGGNRLLSPGLIDLHTHGIGHFLYEHSPEDILSASQFLPQFGTTCALPTLYRVFDRGSLEHLARLAASLDGALGARFPGFHLEGPFLALPGAGAQCIPGDLALLEDLLSACDGKALAMSVSPDTPEILPVIERLVEKGVVPLITHTRATVEQTCLAIEAGAIHGTHFYDVFPLPRESDAGVRACGAVESLLADPRCSVDFIADGVHVHPMAIRCALAAKGFRKVLLITDSNIGAGLPEGVHDTPWGFSVRVQDGRGARVADPENPAFGTLAGSALTMDAGIRNLHRWLNLPLDQVWAMGTLNVATLLGLKDLGRMQAGAAADLVLWNEDLTVCKTWVRGQLVFENHDKPALEETSR
jgi:N-acetylglucosamine-6-phosphate deacetylase